MTSLRAYREAFEAIALKVKGQWQGRVAYGLQEYPFGGPEDAIRKVRLYQLDGPRGLSIGDPDRLEKITSGLSMGSESSSGDTSHRHMFGLVDAVLAVARAYPERVVIASSRDLSIPASAARMLLLMRYAGGRTMRGMKVADMVEPVSRALSEPLSEAQIRNVTTTGLKAVYQYLVVRELVPKRESKDDMREAIPWDLDGWDAIAESLGVSPMTAKRYREKFGMPVYKLGQRIGASRDEIRAWLKTFRSGEEPKP